MLLVSGRKKEALGHAIEGQLWGPALVLAAQLGDQVLIQVYLVFLFIPFPYLNWFSPNPAEEFICWMSNLISVFMLTLYCILYFHAVLW